MSDKNETKHSIVQIDLSLLCMKNILVENTSVKINREWSGVEVITDWEENSWNYSDVREAYG